MKSITVIKFDNASDLKKYINSIDRTKCSMHHAHNGLTESKYYGLNFFVPMWHYDCNGDELWASYDYDNYEYIFIKDQPIQSGDDTMTANEKIFKEWLLKKGPISRQEAALKGRDMGIGLHRIIKIYSSIG